MELIMIGQDRLKIMLSPDDMERFSLETDIDYADMRTRDAFKCILEEAKAKTGFDTEGGRLFIQLYPSKKGGCEVYITKLEDDSTCLCHEFPISICEEEMGAKKEKPGGIVPVQKSKPKERIRFYSFSSTADLISVCNRLSFVKWHGTSSAYRTDKKYYLKLKDRTQNFFLFLDKLSFISEYGACENAETMQKFLPEHAECICESSAVEKLGSL